MAYAPHVKVTFGGDLLSALGDFPTAQEIWACQVNVIHTEGDSTPLDDYLAAIEGPLQTWFKLGASGMSSGATLAWVKANDIDAAGHYVDGTTTHFWDYAVHSPGGAGPQDAPIISTCWTFGTAKGRGPGSKGRIFPPNNTLSPVGSSYINAFAANAQAAAAVNLLKILAATPAVGPDRFVPVVASGVNATNTPITHVAIGSVKDVQRRRKNALLETYTILPFP